MIEDILFDNIPEHIWLGDRNTITQRRRDLAKRLHEALDEAGVCLDVLEPFRTADRSADACTSDDPTNHQGDT